MLRADGAQRPPPVPTRRRGRASPRGAAHGDRGRRADRLGRGERGYRRPHRRRRRDPARGLRRLPAIQHLMRAGLFSTPRPEPGHLLPAAGSAVLILVALPVFLLLDWPIVGWGLAALLWFFVHTIDVVLARVRRPTANLAGSAVQAF